MDFAATLKIALRALARNKMRSVLTMLGIIIGVGAVIAMVGVGQGAQQKVQDQIASMGTNMLFVSSGTVNARRPAHGLGPDQDPGLRRHEGHAARDPDRRHGRARQPAPARRWCSKIRTGPRDVTGTEPQYFDIRDWPMAGRFQLHRRTT